MDFDKDEDYGGLSREEFFGMTKEEMAKSDAFYDEMCKLYQNDPLSTKYGPYAALKEAVQYNLFKEYNGLNKLINRAKELNRPEDKYKIARSLIYGYIIECIRKDPHNGDYYNEQNHQNLKKGGQILYDTEGMRGMHDDLLWSFIPKRYRREIDIAWNGIGEWVS